MNSNLYLIGAGGVGSWLTPSLCLLSSPGQVTVIDGDTLEKKNLNRQLFTDADVGVNKATALAAHYSCNYIGRYYDLGSIDHLSTDWLMVCVDNNAARRDAIVACDLFGCQAILAANETHSAEAYFYKPAWKHGPLDPRVYYPEIETDTAGDPRAEAIGCTGQAQRSNRQLVSANFMAAALAQHLFVLWAMEVPQLDKAIEPNLPHKLVSNLSRLETWTIKRTTDEFNQKEENRPAQTPEPAQAQNR